ncbi:MAG: M20/M25/M40 family metallo-hydrolase [Acidobacteriota bacterium]|nr:M20/M25/M40 family metallo-hydrolase [Acidobacteriota bacterium]
MNSTGRRTALLAAGLTLAVPAPAQDLRTTVEQHVDGAQRALVSELVEAVSIPSVAADAVNIRRKAEFLKASLERRGFAAELLETDGNPLVFGERPAADADRTLLIYFHYDGQPVDPSRWQQEHPFEPVLREGSLADGAGLLDLHASEVFRPDDRIYARSVADDTAPIIALLGALDALDASGVTVTSNLKVILDGEEEAGSPNLVPAIARYGSRFAADVMLILDGPLHQSGRPTVSFGARGILTLELVVYGPRVPLHSGHYGNWAPNPAVRLAQLIASMKDEGGRVVIPGFYDGIDFTAEERRALAAVPDDLPAMMDSLGFAEADRVGGSLQEAIQFPSLNVRGLSSAWVGGDARTIVPATATAAIDVRLVAETPAEAMFAKVRDFIAAEGWFLLDRDPTDAERREHPRLLRLTRSAGTNAFRTPLDHPVAARLIGSLTEIWGEEPVRKRTSGGTVPIAPFVEALGVPALMVPTVNHDNNQHSPNENLRLGHFFRSIVSFAAILTM